MEIIKEYLPEGEYRNEDNVKTQIYLHHTAGNSNPFNVVKDWATDKRGRVGTAYIIGGFGKNDGVIVEAFPPNKWNGHLGIPATLFREKKIPYKHLDPISIGIEICNWGQLTMKDGKYINYVNGEVLKEQVCTLNYPFRGYHYFHKYTSKQIEATRQLLIKLRDEFHIPITYRDDIWNLNNRALKGEPGLYAHVSVRPDKVDVYPQPELIAMLKTL